MLDPSLAQAIAQAIPTIQGWCTVEKGQHLAELVVEQRPGLCVEIGVYAGRSLVALALACRHVGGFAVGIDPWAQEANCDGWDKDDANRDWWSRVDMEPFYAQAQASISIFGLREHCALLRTRAEPAAAVFAAGSVGLLHIDGNHSESAACRDVALYLPKLRPGGLLVFDDANWPSTMLAQRRLAEACELLEDRTSYRVYRAAVAPLPATARLATIH